MSRKASVVVLLFSLLIAGYLVAGVVMQRHDRAGDQPYRELGVYTEVMQHINEDYVTAPNLNLVTDGALHGLLESLDADSSYLDPAEYKRYQASLGHEQTANIGVVLSKRFGYASVVDVRPGGPAAQAGLTRGDFIESIGGTSTRDLSIQEIHNRMWGTPGTPVAVSVVHLHRADPQHLTLTRVLPPVAPLATLVRGDVGYVQVLDINAGRAAQVAAALKKLQGQGVNKFVLDLRNCGEGSFTEAEQLANLFLDHGTITYLEGQTYPRQTVVANPAKRVADGPLAVLVNSGTSGPAEVVAAAVLDNQRAVVVGDKTFGEGSIQKLIPVGDGSAVLLSVARYYTPAGKPVQDGVTPSVQQVEYAGAMPDEDLPPEGAPAPKEDLQLNKAIELLDQAPAKAAAAHAAA